MDDESYGIAPRLAMPCAAGCDTARSLKLGIVSGRTSFPHWLSTLEGHTASHVHQPNSRIEGSSARRSPNT